VGRALYWNKAYVLKRRKKGQVENELDYRGRHRKQQNLSFRQ
jgi:hypothetical protein